MILLAIVFFSTFISITPSYCATAPSKRIFIHNNVKQLSLSEADDFFKKGGLIHIKNEKKGVDVQLRIPLSTTPPQPSPPPPPFYQEPDFVMNVLKSLTGTLETIQAQEAHSELADIEKQITQNQAEAEKNKQKATDLMARKALLQQRINQDAKHSQ